MSGPLQGNTDFEKLEALTERTYKEQGIWFLNSFWEPNAKEVAERVWDLVAKCAEFDLQDHAAGCHLDEMNGHRLLEAFDEALTVRAMRTNLREVGAIGEGNVKFVPLLHVLLFKYAEWVNWAEMVNAPQGNQEQIEKAQSLLAEVQTAFAESEAAASAARIALAEATNRENAAKAAEADAIAREAEAVASAQAAKTAEDAAIQRENESKQAEAQAIAAAEAAAAAVAATATTAATSNAASRAIARDVAELVTGVAALSLTLLGAFAAHVSLLSAVVAGDVSASTVATDRKSNV
eukprot:TRINITY_DN3625_c0_g1_i1.p1 TRINITY_DN3625_c0_g1~~TRINITY_DN3625_c0_g1_i1.p1  ORF type:complete len:294 (+),score=71.15 TRINITY_DN3625_c0_g1_i1:43-924(+)